MAQSELTATYSPVDTEQTGLNILSQTQKSPNRNDAEGTAATHSSPSSATLSHILGCWWVFVDRLAEAEGIKR
eukprot:scaffold348468_cov55-Prasinocladus_malaysianus.AAC.1